MYSMRWSLVSVFVTGNRSNQTERKPNENVSTGHRQRLIRSMNGLKAGVCNMIDSLTAICVLSFLLIVLAVFIRDETR